MCAFEHTEKAGGEPKKRNNSVVVAKTMDHTHAGKRNLLNFRAKGDLLHGVSANPVRSNLQKLKILLSNTADFLAWQHVL